MQRQSWRLRAAGSREQIDALVRELGLSATTASVLVRRGYANVESAQAFLAAELPEPGPYRRGYAVRGLGGSGVGWKLREALRGLESDAPGRHLDMVAVGTVADVVPLVDGNRGLAVAGLRQLARTQKPGLRELMRTARVDPAAVDAGAIGFRLAPRLNAAGRLCRPEAALELLLTDDRETAVALASQPD